MESGRAGTREGAHPEVTLARSYVVWLDVGLGDSGTSEASVSAEGEMKDVTEEGEDEAGE